jgi:hypothetical protein
LTEAGSQFASSRSSNRVPPLSGCWRPTPPAKRYRYQSGEKAASHDSAAVPADAVARESDAPGDLRPAFRPGPGDQFIKRMGVSRSQLAGDKRTFSVPS